MNILAIDDEKLALELLVEAISEAKPDATIMSFRKPSELLDYANKNECDIAFLDIHMRGMTGVEVAKKLKDINPRINIIFVTGFDDYGMDAMKLHASGYVLKPVTKEKIEKELEELRFPIEPMVDKTLKVQCFGNFDVFAKDGTPIHFERSKSKEVFAYLVYKHGSSCTTREIAAILFEDAPYDDKQQGYTQKIISSLQKSLKKVGASDILRKEYNSISIDCNSLDCDYFRFLESDPKAINSYTGEYMEQYYWADFML